jgi:hypothetical protein
VFFTVYVYFSLSDKVSEKLYKIAFMSLLVLTLAAIIGLLIKINPYSVRVDRWSAVSFFLDYLFQGKYPYLAHTHVSTTNFPSPFPIWHIINIPFYLLGDVGIGLIFFLLLTITTIHYFFESYRKSFFFLLLLCISPAYWWEIAVRSDSLSNALLVFVFILWFKKRDYSISTSFWLVVAACGLIASTRLSALLPIALYFFKPFIQLQWKLKILFLASTLCVTIATFTPFILWDTRSWIFFHRNPFMSQASIGNSYLLLAMVLLGCILAMRIKTISSFFNSASIFIFIFVLSAQISLIITKGIHGSIFTDSLYDVSYFTLILPYTLMSIVFVNNKQNAITLSRNNSADYFHTPPANLNCAQAILKGFQSEFKISDKEIEDYRAWGGGRAEGGMCGALFAAKQLLNQTGKESVIQEFQKKVGSTLCKDIKEKKFTCIECVRIADELIEKNL